jgi:short-subunit dehydrogenase
MKKTALITGATSGIGEQLAHIHAEKGGDLVIVARSSDTLQELKKDLESTHGIQVTVIEKDLSKPEAVAEVYQQVSDAGITVDYLINNAGFGGLGKFNERDIGQDVAMINLNVTALTELTHYFLQDFVARDAGKILNVSSTASLLPGPGQAVYYATKAYVTSFSNALHEELHDTNVTVTNLMPGATATKFGEVSGMDKTALFKNPASARSVAAAGYQGMLDGKVDVIAGLSVGQKITMKLLPLLPKKVVLKQVRKMQVVD